MTIIGLSGYAGSGKDTVGKLLISKGFQRVAFGDEVKKALYALNPAIGVNRRTGAVTYLKPLYDGMKGSFDEKWDTLKAMEEVRRLLQRMGTEVGREIFGPDVWVEAAFQHWTGFDAVVTDVRFPNEAEAVLNRGGIVVRVLRDGVGPARDSKGHVHLSEVAIDDWAFDYHITNNGTLAELAESVAATVNDHKRKEKV